VRTAEAAAQPREPIQIKLRGKLSGVPEIEGISWDTRPVTLGKSVSNAEHTAALKAALKDAVVAKVFYKTRVGKQITMADGSGVSDEAAADEAKVDKGELWDLVRPLEGSCELELLDFDDEQGRAVFWHSSAHVLGECLECGYGCHLTVGPPIATGFFYDAYMGERAVHDEMRRDLEAKANQVCTVKQAGQQQPGQAFERLVISKQEALELFAANPFKMAMISAKIPDGAFTTAYRCGPMVDLCMGPHIPNTRAIQGFAVTSCSQANFGGDVNNDSLQRVYGVSFPTKQRLEQHLAYLEEAKANDHRVRGQEQQLFFFHPLSPGSAFWEPAGARIYNTLMEFIRTEYRARGYQEVITPNMFQIELWKRSGHWQHYAENMFSFTDGEEHLDGASGEGKTAEEVQRAKDHSTYALKPMNCPGHCLIFAHRDRSYRELPYRMADFGVLHRKELTGALSGLTRVRRFQQDDAHIFCTAAQIKDEVRGALEFMKKVYDTFGMTYRLERSTRPAKASGLDTAEGVALWDLAEAQLAEAMDAFQGAGTWKDNPGDGAFYGPKIDIKVYDAHQRVHQCATIQLDFQNPLRFDLHYASDKQTIEKPVMIHRAMLGSLERMIAILTEHFRGRWPFWLAPRQLVVVPMLAGAEADNTAATAYAARVAAQLAEFFVDVPHSGNNNHNDAIKRAFEQGTKFVLCVGPSEVAKGTVSVEGRQPAGSKDKAPLHYGTCTVDDAKAWFRRLRDSKVLDENVASVEPPAFVKVAYGKKKEAGTEPAGKRAQDHIAPPPAQHAPPAKQAARAAVVAAGTYQVAGEVFPTSVPKLLGQSFASVEDFVRHLSA